MSVQAVEKYKNFFLDEVKEDRKDLSMVKKAMEQIEIGTINLKNHRTRLVVLPSNTPSLDYLERNLKNTMFPFMSMDDLSMQCLHPSRGSGSGFFGDVENLSSEFVAARALVLMSKDFDTNQVLNIFMPERKNRVCLRAMDMLMTDFKPNKILKVRLPWKALSGFESTY